MNVRCHHPLRSLANFAHPWQSTTMVDTEVLFRVGDAAQGEGNFDHARRAFERGAALGDVDCLVRLAYMFDVGCGIEADKSQAMRLYQRAWRRGNTTAGLNIAILYRERQNARAMFQWWQRVARTGDGSALFEMAKCYLAGIGVRNDGQAALRCLARAVRSRHISEAEREEAIELLSGLRPRQV